MDNLLDIKSALANLREVFESSATELVWVMFGKTATVIEPWIVSESSDTRYDYVFRQISENQLFKINVVIGVSNPALQALFGEDASLEYARDALGEFANCYYAMLMERSTFVEQFGILTQRVPEDSTMLACFPLACGIQGRLRLNGGKTLFIRFSVEENRFDADLLAFLDNESNPGAGGKPKT